MKYVVTFVVIFIALVANAQEELPAEVKEKLFQFAQKCIKETSVDLELLKKDHAGEVANDKNVKCFHKCFMVEMGTMDSGGKINFDKMAEQIPAGEKHDKVMAAVDKCKGEKGSDPCELAYAVQKCMYAATKDIFKL